MKTLLPHPPEDSVGRIGSAGGVAAAAVMHLPEREQMAALTAALTIVVARSLENHGQKPDTMALGTAIDHVLVDFLNRHPMRKTEWMR